MGRNGQNLRHVGKAASVAGPVAVAATRHATAETPVLSGLWAIFLSCCVCCVQHIPLYPIWDFWGVSPPRSGPSRIYTFTQHTQQHRLEDPKRPPHVGSSRCVLCSAARNEVAQTRLWSAFQPTQRPRRRGPSWRRRSAQTRATWASEARYKDFTIRPIDSHPRPW